MRGEGGGGGECAGEEFGCVEGGEGEVGVEYGSEEGVEGGGEEGEGGEGGVGEGVEEGVGEVGDDEGVVECDWNDGSGRGSLEWGCGGHGESALCVVGSLG